jgi:hypothetical protein
MNPGSNGFGVRGPTRASFGSAAHNLDVGAREPRSRLFLEMSRSRESEDGNCRSRVSGGSGTSRIVMLRDNSSAYRSKHLVLGARAQPRKD